MCLKIGAEVHFPQYYGNLRVPYIVLGIKGQLMMKFAVHKVGKNSDKKNDLERIYSKQKCEETTPTTQITHTHRIFRRRPIDSPEECSVCHQQHSRVRRRYHGYGKPSLVQISLPRIFGKGTELVGFLFSKSHSRNILLMVQKSIIYRVLYMSGDCLGFLPSTVSSQILWESYSPEV